MSLSDGRPFFGGTYFPPEEEAMVCLAAAFSSYFRLYQKSREE